MEKYGKYCDSRVKKLHFISRIIGNKHGLFGKPTSSTAVSWSSSGRNPVSLRLLPFCQCLWMVVITNNPKKVVRNVYYNPYKIYKYGIFWPCSPSINRKWTSVPRNQVGFHLIGSKCEFPEDLLSSGHLASIAWRPRPGKLDVGDARRKLLGGIKKKFWPVQLELDKVW